MIDENTGTRDPKEPNSIFPREQWFANSVFSEHSRTSVPPVTGKDCIYVRERGSPPQSRSQETRRAAPSSSLHSALFCDRSPLQATF